MKVTLKPRRRLESEGTWSLPFEEDGRRKEPVSEGAEGRADEVDGFSGATCAGRSFPRSKRSEDGDRSLTRAALT